MIQLTCWRLRQICDVLRASVWDADRDPNFPVLIETGPGGVKVSAQNGDEAVAWCEAGTFAPQTFTLPASVLEGLAGWGDSPVFLEALPLTRCCRVGWGDGGGGWSQV